MTNKTDIADQHHATYESIRHVDGDGNEYWNARQLAVVSEYSQYRHFLPVLERAKEIVEIAVSPLPIILRMSSQWSRLVQEQDVKSCRWS